jgi:tetratricopeptide (TPR) repeat protein
MDWTNSIDLSTAVPLLGLVIALVTLLFNHKQLRLTFRKDSIDTSQRREQVFERCAAHFATLGVYPFSKEPASIEKSKISDILRQASMLAASEPDNPDALALMAHCFLLQGHLKKTIRCADKALSHDSAHREALKALFWARMNQKHFSRAASVMARGMKSYPDSADFVFGMARLYRARGELALAEEFARRAVTLDPHYFFPYRLLIEIYREKQDTTNLEDWLTRARSQFPENRSVLGYLLEFALSNLQGKGVPDILEGIGFKESNRVFFVLAEIIGFHSARGAVLSGSAMYTVLNDKEYVSVVDSGLEYCELQLKENSMDTLTLHISGLLKGIKYLTSKDRSWLDEAVHNLERAASLVDQDDICFNLAFFYLMQNRIDDTKRILLRGAMASLEKGDNAAPSIYIEFAIALRDAPPPDIEMDADSAFEAILKDCVCHFPEYLPAYGGLSELYEKRGRLDDQYALEKLACLNDAATPDIMISFAWRAIVKRDWDVALQVLDTIDDGKHLPAALFCHAICLFARSDYAAGNRLLNQAYERGFKPADTDYQELGHVFYELENFVDAASAFGSAIEENPRQAQHYSWRGNSLLRMSRYDDAIKDLLLAERMNSSDEWALRDLAFCFEQTGDEARAIEYCKKLLKLNPDSAFAKDKIDQYYQPRSLSP